MSATRRHLLLPALLLAAACGGPGADDGPAPDASSGPGARERVERGLLPAVVVDGIGADGWTLAERMERYRVPGVSIALINDGRVEWVGAYGVRDPSGEPVLPTTPFQAASLSKPVTAVGVVGAAAEGALDTADDVAARLPGWEGPDGVTPERLLSHTAGTNVSAFPGYARGGERPSLEAILAGRPPAHTPAVRVEGTPGEGFRYSGGGFVVLEAWLEATTGEPFVEWIARRVLGPAGMGDSTFEQPLPESFRGREAVGHRRDGSPVEGGWRVYPEHAAAGLWTTPSDLAALSMALIDAFHGRPNPLLSRPALGEMLRPRAGGAGLGWAVGGEGAAFHFRHAGSNAGYAAFLVVFPATGDGVVVMCNGDGGSTLTMEVVRAAARAYGWPAFAPLERAAADVPAGTLAALAGAYDLDGHDAAFAIEAAEDHLYLATPSGARYTFYPEDEARFFSVEDDSTLVFGSDDAGHATLDVWGVHGHRDPEGS